MSDQLQTMIDAPTERLLPRGDNTRSGAMDGQELAAMTYDFERWFHESEWFDMTDARLALAEQEFRRASALIECAVLDELERRGFCVQVSAWGVIVGNGFTGDGPTRLHRLHAACLAAFGTEARP